MELNAYILDWTMIDYDILQQELADIGLYFEKVDRAEHLRVAVPFERVGEFSAICQQYLEMPYHYVEVQYPALNKTILIFRERDFVITDDEKNERVKAWAITQGLPAAQAEWATSF